MKCLFYKIIHIFFSLLVVFMILSTNYIYGEEHPFTLYYEISLGHDVIIQNLRSDALLNPYNDLGLKELQGKFFQNIFIDSYVGENINFRLQTSSEWFFWNESLDTETIGSRLYGFAGEQSFDIESWELRYTTSSALFSCGTGKIVWTPGPAKQLKAANYFEWLFGSDGKTLIWAGLTFANASLKTVYAPRGEWVPDSFIEPSANVLPGESVFYIQGQLYYNAFDSGCYVGYDSDISVGAWMSYMINKDLLIYSEASWSSKEWISHLNESSFLIDLKNKNGMRVMGGVLYSPSFLNFSLYCEGMYIGDAYTETDWQNLANTLIAIESIPGIPATGIRSSLLQTIRWGYMNPWNFAINIKPNESFLEIFDWIYSIRYSIPGDWYSRFTLNIMLPGNIQFDVQWDSPFAFCFDNIVKERDLFVYGHKLEISLIFNLNTNPRL